MRLARSATFLAAEMNFAKAGQESARRRPEVAADKNVRAPLNRYGDLSPH